MKIKQLEWSGGSAQGFLQFKTVNFGWSYEIREFNKGYCVLFYPEYSPTYRASTHASFDEAREAAQADFEQRVMACFETDDKSNFWG